LLQHGNELIADFAKKMKTRILLTVYLVFNLILFQLIYLSQYSENDIAVLPECKIDQWS